MAKKEIIVGVKKNNIQACNIEFEVRDKSFNPNDLFCDIKKSIYDLEINKEVVVAYKKEYLISYKDFLSKIKNIVFGHSRKHIEKRFTTNSIYQNSVTVTRHTDRIFGTSITKS